MTLWDFPELTTPEPLLTAGQGTEAPPVAFDDPDGGDRVVVWDALAPERVADLPLASSVGGAVAFHPDGTTLAATDRERVRFWDLDPRQATTRICATLGRSLTRAQWDELIGDRRYRATCDG